jgi:hypothetical protein
VEIARQSSKEHGWMGILRTRHGGVTQRLQELMWPLRDQRTSLTYTHLIVTEAFLHKGSCAVVRSSSAVAVPNPKNSR